MCGIVAYLGNKEAYPILIKGLQRLEYRGYDSAGVALLDSAITVHKCKGKVVNLQEHIGTQSTKGTVGIGHTRWATHGAPNDVNAHPHQSESGELVMIHNGIIENYTSLKKELVSRGYTFKSETDTEVLVNLIEDIQKNNDGIALSEAVRIALNEVIGAYAIVVMSKSDPDKIVAAKKSSPLVIGIGEDDFYLASDATPIVEYTKNVVYMEDEEIAILEKGKELRIISISNQEKTPYVQELEMQLEAADVWLSLMHLLKDQKKRN